jgi:hypothetical protein
MLVIHCLSLRLNARRLRRRTVRSALWKQIPFERPRNGGFPVLFGVSGWTTHCRSLWCWVVPASLGIIRLGASLGDSRWITDRLRQSQTNWRRVS